MIVLTEVYGSKFISEYFTVLFYNLCNNEIDKSFKMQPDVTLKWLVQVVIKAMPSACG